MQPIFTLPSYLRIPTGKCLSIFLLAMTVYSSQAQERDATSLSLGNSSAPVRLVPNGNFPDINAPAAMRKTIMAADIPQEQLSRECFFFGGDSLVGFNFEAAKAQAYAEGNTMYSEFRVFMFREQAKFVKAKYNIAMLPFETVPQPKRKNADPPPSAMGACGNLDIETGDFTGWVGGSGYNTNSNAPLTVAGTAYYNIDQSIYDCNDFQLITAAYGNDPVGGFPGKDPNGGNYSARLGGHYINEAAGYAGCPGYHWSALYSNGEYIEQTFAVTAANALLSYDYAVILNDGAHPNGQQPYFHVEITNTSGVPLSTCTQYYVQAPAGAPPPGFTLSSYSTPNTYYKGWTANSVNLTPYIGQNVVAKFTAAGCTQGGHFGYAYMDAHCGPAQILTSNVYPCIGTNATLTAPPVAGGTYLWSGPGIVGANNGQNVVVNANGTYSVTVTPSQGPGCAYALQITVTFVSLNAPLSTSNDVSCFGGSNGSASVNVSGGSPIYTYAWSPSGGNAATANNLAAGNYVVTVTDANGCTTTTPVTINQPVAALSNTVASTVAGCTVANGTASAGASGGTPNYTYAWSPSGGNAATASNLASGSYVVTVTDSKGCTTTSNITVGVSANPTATASATQSTCGNANGTATANGAGGTPGYSYLWSNGQITQTATGLVAGNYIVTVTDANGCTGSTVIAVTSATGPTLAASVLTNVSCNGGNNGSATATPTGGTPGFTYVWSNGQSTQTATGLAAGTHTVTVTDANNCQFVTTTTVTEPTALATTVTPINALCSGGNSGSATANPSGGTPGYTYVWDNGQLTQTATGLASGTYTVTVTDANGCTVVNTVTINQPVLLSSTVSQTNVLCNGGNSGSASVTPAGGTPNYSYAWSPNGGNAATANNLTAGNYVVTVTDANGCTTTNSVTVTEPTALAATSTQTNVGCNGGSNGSASVNVSGGTANYTYAWSPFGGNASSASGLIAGSYVVTITDANGCTTTVPVTITQPTAVTLAATSTNVLCNGGNTGSATATSGGGTPGYSYQWSPSGGNAATATGLSVGTYQCVVTDANGCTALTTVTISEPPPITLSVSGNDSACRWDNTVLTATPAGGTPAYTYAWSPVSGNGSTITVSPSVSTSYTVTMTDANGCVSTVQTFNLTINPGPTALFDTTLATGNFNSTYTFTDQSSGGATSWLWMFGDNTTSTDQNPVHTFPGAGTYTVTQIVYNQFGCPDTFQITVVFEPGILIPNVFTPNGDGQNEEWYIPNSGVKDFHVIIYDRWGLKLFETTADEIRWDGRSSAGRLLADGTYYYTLNVILLSNDGNKDYSTSGYVTLLTTARH